MKTLRLVVPAVLALFLGGCAMLRDYANYKAEMDARCATSCCCHCVGNKPFAR